jgi:predicted nucleic acid-binding protein
MPHCARRARSAFGELDVRHQRHFGVGASPRGLELNFRFLDFDESTAVHAGRIRAYLEPRGIKIGPMGTLLAAHALSIGATVVTGNMREFARVPGLAAENRLH